jgi:ATP-dependent DNA helicase MPH1
LYDANNHDNEAVENVNKPKGRKLKNDPNFRILMQELETQKAIGFALHPKMEELLNVLIQHFGQLDTGDETRVMVFSSYRAVVDRIVEELSKHEPLLRAARFIGQGTDKQGKKGLAQKEQLEVCVRFF